MQEVVVHEELRLCHESDALASLTKTVCSQNAGHDLLEKQLPRYTGTHSYMCGCGYLTSSSLLQGR